MNGLSPDGLQFLLQEFEEVVLLKDHLNNSFNALIAIEMVYRLTKQPHFKIR